MLLSGCGTKENNLSMLEQSNETDDVISTSSKQDFTNYIGTWSDRGISFEKGGFILDVSIDGKEMTLDFSLVSSGHDSYTAELSENISLSDITDNVATIDYEDDGWGNSGTVEITFSSSYILIDFKNVILDSMANWGFYENTYKLEKNEQAHSIITQGSNDYYEDNPVEITPVYDTSKASGILASLGMTEDEFRNSCQALNHSKYNYHLSKKTTVPYVEIIDIQRNPNAYIGQHFVFAENPYEELPCKYCHGEDLSEMPKDSCSHDGKLHDDGLYYYKQKNTNKLVPYELNGSNRFTNAYGDSVISGASYDIFLVYDLRDDIYSPTITSDANVIAYMIFDGITSSNMLQFSMISCDVIYND
ncbi:MAG: hypothetical protein IJN56_07435 [Clostridia bacterium]|nr:hypothetical protein [Clostridia bacterium]